jgi:hypothetical protein
MVNKMSGTKSRPNRATKQSKLMLLRRWIVYFSVCGANYIAQIGWISVA